MRLRCEAHGKCAHWFLASVALRRKSLKAQSGADVSALFLNTEGTWRRWCVDQSAHLMKTGFSLSASSPSVQRQARQHAPLPPARMLIGPVVRSRTIVASHTFWVSSPRSWFGLDFSCPSSLASLRHLKRSVGGILGVFLGELFQAAEVTGFRNSHFITEWDSLSLKTRRFPLSRVSSCVTG